MDTKKTDSFAWVEWIVAEREKREWSQADLARKVETTRQTINDYESRRRANPDEKILVRISQAFGYSPEYLPRLAGLLPPEPRSNEEIKQIVREVEGMSKEEQLEILSYIRWRNNRRKKQ